MNRSVPRVPLRQHRSTYGLLDAPLRVLQQQLTKPVSTHWHEFYELAYMGEGSGTHWVNGRAARVRPGALIGLTPADFHQLEPDPGGALEVIVVIFAAELLDHDVQQLLLSAPWPLRLTFAEAPRESLEADLHRLHQEESEARPGGPAALRATLQRILIDLVRAAGAGDVSAHGHPEADAVRDALLYLHHRFRQPVRLADVAAQAHMSPNYFSQRFRELTGVPFVRYRRDLRLQFARSLIAVSDLPITEICYAAGFNTLSHFERAFNARWGCAPRTLRSEPAKSSAGSPGEAKRISRSAGPPGTSGPA